MFFKTPCTNTCLKNKTKQDKRKQKYTLKFQENKEAPLFMKVNFKIQKLTAVSYHVFIEDGNKMMYQCVLLNRGQKSWCVHIYSEKRQKDRGGVSKLVCFYSVTCPASFLVLQRAFNKKKQIKCIIKYGVTTNIQMAIPVQAHK